jgi:catechol 2,3-dioxygenase-like lactoylglutathione lyase family enzyme
MSTTDMSSDTRVQGPGTGKADLKLEVLVLGVADVDRSKAFYEGLGWRLDADFPIDEHFRVVQFTPPGSPASIQFGTGVTTMEPGAVKDIYLAVDDVQAARAELIAKGADVSEVWHGRGLGSEGHVPGRDPEGGSYRSFASFSDPDGNSYLLQEVTERLPGRVEQMDVASLAALLLDTAQHHDPYEKSSQPHDWWDWYAAYLSARLAGSSQEEASASAGRYMAETKHVLPL